MQKLMKKTPEYEKLMSDKKVGVTVDSPLLLLVSLFGIEIY